MSFANDILKKVQPVVKSSSSVVVKKKKVYYTGNHPFRNTEALQNGLFAARLKNKNHSVYLGVFTNRKRAGIASRLYRLWMERGYDNIPTGSGFGLNHSLPGVSKVEDSVLLDVMETYGPTSYIYDIAKELREMRFLIYGSARAMKI